MSRSFTTLPLVRISLAVGLMISALVVPARASRVVVEAPAPARCCVWKVTSGDATLYLAGSVHALRSQDYPLPAAYDQAFDQSTELFFETDPNAKAETWAREMGRAATLPDGVTLKDKVDPRTYAYILRVIKQVKGSTSAETKIQHLRPWALGMMVQAPDGAPKIASSMGVESYFYKKAEKAHKHCAGLVPLKQHIAVLGGMSDEDSEIFLLMQFINRDTNSTGFDKIVSAWKTGDADTINRTMRTDYKDAPSFYQRLITDRNRLWMPKLEGFLHDRRQTRLVVVGAAHTAGDEGLPALLRKQGYQVEQL